MAHEDAGHYGAKHPPGTTYDPDIAEALADNAYGERVTCKAAHEVAEDLGVAPSEVGKTADLLEFRIIECQLALFGYGPVRPAVPPAVRVPFELRDELDEHTDDGRIACVSCWMIAERLGVAKKDITAACESLGTKVNRCQLGAF